MTPYEVFFFSSGGVEEGWSRQDLMEARANVLVGFPGQGFEHWAHDHVTSKLPGSGHATE